MTLLHRALPLTLLLAGAASAAQLGSTTALARTGICTVFDCKGLTTTKLNDRVTYVGAPGGGAFAYLVGGRLRLMGWYGFPQGDSPLYPSWDKVNRFALLATGRPVPTALKNHITATGWDGTKGINVDSFKGKTFLSGTAIFGGVPGSGPNARYTAFYVAEAAYARELSTLINRQEPAVAIAAAERFFKTFNLTPKAGGCQLSSSIGRKNQFTEAQQDRWYDTLVALGFNPTGCCGAPPTFHLPGLSGSFLYIDPYHNETDVCVGTG